MDTKEVMQKLRAHFGSREGLMGSQLVWLSLHEEPCDLTFYDSKPFLEVTISPNLGAAVMYGAGAEKLAEMLRVIELKDGRSVQFEEIWTIHQMPRGGFTKAELDAVDLAEGEERIGPEGQTMREMIRDTYHCESRDEEDHFLRRHIAS